MADGLQPKHPVIESPHPEIPEITLEKKGEQKVATVTGEKGTHSEQEAIPSVPIPARPSLPHQQKKSPLRQEIENVLEEDLVELYRSLTPRQKAQFKETGEKTAAQIEKLLKKIHVTVLEIIRLIRRWLIVLPGVNIFFVEQEAKIKAERLVALKDKDTPHE